MIRTAPSENTAFDRSSAPSITTPKYACYVEMDLDDRSYLKGNGRLKQGVGNNASQERYFYRVY